jgi:hypothetical protein
MTASVHERMFANGCLVIGVRDALGPIPPAQRLKGALAPGASGAALSPQPREKRNAATSPNTTTMAVVQTRESPT